jgi:hypothetical protein
MLPATFTVTREQVSTMPEKKSMVVRNFIVWKLLTAKPPTVSLRTG